MTHQERIRCLKSGNSGHYSYRGRSDDLHRFKPLKIIAVESEQPIYAMHKHGCHEIRIVRLLSQNEILPHQFLPGIGDSRRAF